MGAKRRTRSRKRDFLFLVAAGSLPVVTPESLSRLRPVAKAVKQCRRQVATVKAEVSAADAEADSLDRQIASALTARGHKDLATAMDQVGGLVSQLRRRVQADERLDQMTLYQQELEEQSRGLLDRQLLTILLASLTTKPERNSFRDSGSSSLTP